MSGNPNSRPADRYAQRQLELLAIRSSEYADRVAAGKIGFIDAVDCCYSAACWSGLVDEVGDDRVQLVLAAAFGAVRKPA
jgi:hypothetical protein